MEEVGDDFPDGLFIVYEGFEDFRLAVCWDDVVIGNGSWHETGVAFRNGYFIACTSYSQLAIAIENHQDDERIILDHVAMEWLGSLDYLDAEEWSVQYLIGCSYIFTMICTVFRIYIVVDSL